MSNPKKTKEVRESPGKGRGLFATCDIPRGRTFIKEPPLLRAPEKSMNVVNEEFSKLPPEKQKKYMELSDMYTGPYITPVLYKNSTKYRNWADGKSPFGIFMTNGWRGDLIFYTISFINHDCTPNSVVMNGEIRNIRNILRGEEVLVSYFGMPETFRLTHAYRRARLKNTWKFECKCTTCTGERYYYFHFSIQIQSKSNPLL